MAQQHAMNKLKSGHVEVNYNGSDVVIGAVHVEVCDERLIERIGRGYVGLLQERRARGKQEELEEKPRKEEAAASLPAVDGGP